VAVLVIISNIKPAAITDPAEVINRIDIPFMLFIFLSGVIAAAALVIPGVSGSFMLLLIGIYPLVTYSISSIRGILTDITNVSLMIDIARVLVPLGLGIVTGGLSMARLIERLLKNYYKITYSIILGLLIGSIYALFREPALYRSGLTAFSVLLGIVTLLAGCVISYSFGKKRL
jgi:putative membrane protein